MQAAAHCKAARAAYRRSHTEGLLHAAVEERCEAIKAAADEAVAKLMQQLKMQLLQLPKKVHQNAANAGVRMPNADIVTISRTTSIA